MSEVESAPIGERMRAARESRGWTQSEVAKRLQVGRGVVWRAETGRFHPTLAWLARYARAIGVRGSQLDERLR